MPSLEVSYPLVQGRLVEAPPLRPDLLPLSQVISEQLTAAVTASLQQELVIRVWGDHASAVIPQ